MKFKIIILFVVFVMCKGYSQSPPDEPLAPQEWINKMGLGGWWIFTVPPAPDTNIPVNYSTKILDSLQTKFCFNGGRLHWVADDMYDANDELLQEPLDNLRAMIDDFMDRDMAISLNIQFLTTDEQKNFMTENKQKMKNAWAKVCDEFKDVSHNLALCPVIEFHGWDNLEQSVKQDSLNKLYDELTLIFREKNPTRIMSYKPWGSARRAEFNTLAYPFGGDPLPADPEQFYYVSSFSGSAGMGDWQNWTPTMPQAELDALHFQTMNAGDSRPEKLWGIRAALDHRTSTGIPFWMDHWRPNYHKHANDGEQWTMEQNIAYSKFFINKMEEIGSAGAMYQTRIFWSDDTDDLIRQDASSSDEDIMSVMFMDFLEVRCETSSALGYNDYDILQNNLILYPNPVSDIIFLEMDKIHLEEFQIYNLLGQNLSKKITIENISQNKLSINCESLASGSYILISENAITKIIKL
jgi:hypothetical protein